MSQRHSIHQTSIAFDFIRLADAEAFESCAAQWVVQHLLPVIETVFDELCSPHQTLVIDTLTLDLGEFSSATFYSRAPEKLKQLLQEQIRNQLRQAMQLEPVPLKSAKNPAVDEPQLATLLSARQQRWNQLWQFLSTGILPWSMPVERSLEALGLAAGLAEYTVQFNDELHRSSRPGAILHRVVEQLPATCLAALFSSLAPAHQWQIMSLLLTRPDRNKGELPGLLAQAWYARFTHLLARHNLASLRLSWQKLIPQFAPQLIEALYQRHTDSQLPGVLLRDLTQADRLLLLSVLTPQEYPFLAAVLQAPKLWQIKIPADSTRAITEAPTGDFRAILPESKLQQHLWLFTLHYLLVDRGSVFNRQSYMSGLVVRMASAQNQSVDTLLASLISAVDNTAIDSTLRAQLLDLLLTLQLSATSVTFSSASTMPEIAEAPAMPDDESSSLSGESPLNDLTELVIALCSGQETQLIQFWPTNRPAFAALLRWCGQLDAVRRHWAETYPEKTLLALADVLAPRAAFFIQTLLAERPLFSTFTSTARTERTAHTHLWQCTFAFLIVETRSAFNRRSYLRYLLQQMAAQGNIAYADLLDDMLSHVAGRGGFSPSATALGTLLAGLAQTSRPAQPEEISLGYTSSLPPSRLNAFSPAQLNDIGEIVLTLQNANLSQWNHHIEPWQRHYGKQLQPIIRDTGLNASTIKRWVSHFDDPALFTLTTIINPYAKETVRGILNEENIIEKAIRRAPGAIAPTNTRHALWELTLHYLLSRRGSEFNQYQYLLNLTGQLSARYQVKTEILIQEWLSLSDSGFLWRQQLLELVGHQTEIPATGPQLLNNIQSASQPPGISPAQHTLLHRYISINASAVATQLQRWDPLQLERLVRLMQPQVNERVIALLPVLLAIVRRFTLAPHWFYQLLLSGDCPATPEKWFRRLMQQINRQGTSPAPGRYLQLRQLVLNSQDIKFSRADRERWLYSITPEEALLTEIQSWFEGKARVPEQTLFTSLIQTPSGRDYLRRALANPRYLQRWLEELTPATHQALLFPRFNHATLALLDLRHAFCQLLAAPKQGEYLFWQTLYRQHWLKGITLTSRQLMPALLIELNQAWLAHTNAAPTPQNAPLTGLTTRLLPLIVSASLQKALTQMAHLPVPRQPQVQPWTAQLHHQRPEIKQLIEAIEMPNKTVSPEEGTPWKKRQDDEDASSDPVTLFNAGLVIASTYIPMLFQRLALTDGQKFVSREAQHQALFCLLWMSHRTDSAPEYQLLLNKVLCGVEPSTPIPQHIPLPDGAESLIEGLLTAIIAHWKVLGNTSVSGLQTTFIQREGLLTFTPQHWQLNVIPGTFDMLLDQLPWRFQTIKYPWMDKPLFVSWR